MALTQSQEDIPLITQNDAHHSTDDGFGPASSKEKSRACARSTGSILLLLASVVSLLSLTWNIIALNIDKQHPRPQPRIDVARLRRPSLYLGLERVQELRLAHGHTVPHSNAPGEDTVPPSGWPRVRARVNSMYPADVLEHDNWVLLTEHDHTTLEFAALEGHSCAFKAVFPPRRSLRDKLVTLETDNPDNPTASPIVEFFVVPTQQGWSTLTWNNRLRPGPAPLAKVVAQFGQNSTSKPFNCLSQPLVVEAACAGRGCRVEFDASPSLLSIEPVVGIQLVVVST